MKRIAVFDLDYTLLRVNSQYLFTESFLKKNSVWRYFVFRLFSITIIYKFIAFLFKRDFRRVLSLWLLKRFKRRHLTDYANKLFCDNSIVNDDVYSLLNSVRDKGYLLILATAAPDFIAEIFQKMFSFEDMVCTVLHNGNIAIDVTGKKMEFIRNKYKNHIYSLFVSDNEEDLNEEYSIYVYVKHGKLFKKTSLKELDLCL